MGNFSEIITGPMRSGKSAYLLDKISELKGQGQRVLAFKPVLDVRDGMQIKSRNGAPPFRAEPITNARQVIKTTLHQAGGSTDQTIGAVFIDEIHLLQNCHEILLARHHLTQHGISVYMAGLDTDFRGLPFNMGPHWSESMAALIPHFDSHVQLAALCAVCEAPAHWTQRLVDDEPAPWDAPLIEVGDQQYEPRCLSHYQPPAKVALPKVRNKIV